MWPLGLSKDPAALSISKLGLCSDLSRRQFLRRGFAGATTFGSLAALTQTAYADLLTDALTDGPGDMLSHREPARAMLFNRTSFGFSRAWNTEWAAFDHDEYLARQLNPETIDDSEMDDRLAAYTTLDMSSQQIFDAYEEEATTPIFELMAASLDRAAYSRRQLHEVMVEFWTDHFNVYIVSELVPFLKTADDRDVIRQHALGTFPELLSASAHSAAMLLYLDNYINQVGHAQENYARELMELHTLGVTGPFNQQDVEEVARCFTGWTVYDTPVFGTFAFWEPWHDTGSKVVLGENIPAGGGESDGQTVLDMLAYHPSTAAFISRKLCAKFLGYNPSSTIVDQVTTTYMQTGGDIKSMLRVILSQDTLLEHATPKIKRPFHQLASLIRASGVDAAIQAPPTYPYLFALLSMGHLPFYWPAPNGYPDALGAWGTSQLPRWQTASWFFDGALGTSVDVNSLAASEPGVGQASAISRILTGGTMSANETAALQQFYDDLPHGDPLALTDTFGLAASMPGAQWY
jgi:uncharacterized protein (DUF1800 family)